MKFWPQAQNPFLGKFGPKNSKLSVLPENWCTIVSQDADSESSLRFLKFRPQNQFLGKFGPKNSELSVLSENWYTKYLKDVDSESSLRFLKFRPQNSVLGKFGPKNLKLSIFLKIGTYGISRMLILIPTLVFWISNPNYLFGQIWAKKVKFVHFAWKLAHLVSWGCGFLFQD